MNPYYAVKTTNFIFTKIWIVNNICKQTISTLGIYQRIYLTESSNCRLLLGNTTNHNCSRNSSASIYTTCMMIPFILIYLDLFICFISTGPSRIHSLCVCALASLTCCITLATPQSGHMFLSASPSPGLTFHRLRKIISNTLIPSH